MNFQDLKKIEKPQFYLDVAFRRAGEKSATMREKQYKDKLTKSRQIELQKLEIVKQTIINALDQILRSYPSIDSLDEFYVELIKCTLDYVSLKKSLGALNWCNSKINDFYKIYKSKILRVREIRHINNLRREYYGRVSSLIKQIKSNLLYLEQARKTMKSYPAIKTKLFTVCIFGFPNVGKTTLLSRLTSATPEIAAYPFTTKGLNLGYFESSYNKIQLIDTPGTLNRFDKMNNIEKQAYLAVKHLAHLIIYVLDPTGEYPMEDQKKLLEKIRSVNKPVLVFISKTDLPDAKDPEQMINEFSAYTDHDVLKKKITEYSNQFAFGEATI